MSLTRVCKKKFKEIKAIGAQQIKIYVVKWLHGRDCSQVVGFSTHHWEVTSSNPSVTIEKEKAKITAKDATVVTPLKTI